MRRNLRIISERKCFLSAHFFILNNSPQNSYVVLENLSYLLQIDDLSYELVVKYSKVLQVFLLIKSIDGPPSSKSIEIKHLNVMYEQI